MKRLLALFIAVLLVSACSGTNFKMDTKEITKIVDPYMDESITKIPLEDRGWSNSKRKFYVENSYIQSLLKKWEITAFVNKYPTMGLSKEMVGYMYGRPNRNINDSTWVYLNKRKRAVLVLKFNDNGQLIDYKNN